MSFFGAGTELTGLPIFNDDPVVAMIICRERSIWKRLRILYYMMMTLRITLSPTGAAGSQDGDLKSYQARNCAVAAQIKRANERFD